MRAHMLAKMFLCTVLQHMEAHARSLRVTYNSRQCLLSCGSRERERRRGLARGVGVMLGTSTWLPRMGLSASGFIHLTGMDNVIRP